MGTVQIPEQHPEEEKNQNEAQTDPSCHVDETFDIPRIGPLMWVLLACLLVPPALVTFLGNVLGPIPNQRLWVVLLGLPFPLLFISMPRRYEIKGDELIVSGLLYKMRIRISSILSVKPIGRLKALFVPGSVFCSDPARALMVERDGKMAIIISPREKKPFLDLNKDLDHHSA